MTDTEQAKVERVANLELALGWALGVLIKYESGDSRAVSDEFVAAGAICCDIQGNREECRTILAAAMETDDGSE